MDTCGNVMEQGHSERGQNAMPVMVTESEHRYGAYVFAVYMKDQKAEPDRTDMHVKAVKDKSKLS
jgi:hypothetical protein